MLAHTRWGGIGIGLALLVLAGTACSGNTSKPTPTTTTATPSAPATATASVAAANAEAGVQVVEGVQGAPAKNTSFSTAKEALTYASSKTGFDVAMPAFLPNGYALVTISIPEKRPAGVPAGPLTATLTIRTGGAGFTILEMNTRFGFPGDDAGHVIAAPAPGSQVYKSDPSNRADGKNGWDYHLLTPTRGADLIVPGNLLTDDQAIRILSSMPQN